MAEQMVVIDGVRYRREDAKRLGLLDSDGAAKSKAPKNKARKAVSNKTAEPSKDEE